MIVVDVVVETDEKVERYLTGREWKTKWILLTSRDGSGGGGGGDDDEDDDDVKYVRVCCDVDVCNES